MPPWHSAPRPRTKGTIAKSVLVEPETYQMLAFFGSPPPLKTQHRSLKSPKMPVMTQPSSAETVMVPEVPPLHVSVARVVEGGGQRRVARGEEGAAVDRGEGEVGRRAGEGLEGGLVPGL